ncbi:MAG: AraC family transcriptional regulator, partial [Actinomycetota bacterium]
MDTEPVADDLTPIRTAPGVVITRLGRPHSAPAQPVDPAHRLVWAAGSGLVARVGADQVGVRAPFGLWAPAGIAVDISSDDELREIWFDPATCPLGWSRVERPLLDGVGDELLAIGAPERTSVVRDAAQRVVDRLLDWFVAVEPPLRLPSDPRAREVAAAVMAEPGLDRDLLRWSELVGTSERTLRRLFSGETGLSFRRWQHTVRMTHAARLLADGVPVAVVANRTGYASVRSFRSGFRTMWGRRPEDVRSGPPASPSTLGWPLDVRSWPDDRTPGRHDPLAPLVNQTSREDVDMIRGAAGAMLVAAAFVLAACGGDGDDDGAGDATTTAEPTTAAEPTVDSSAASAARPAETAHTKIFVGELGREGGVPGAPQ